MRKDQAIDLLGGTKKAAAHALGMTPQAIHNWPDPLPRPMADRVLGVRLRMEWREALQTMDGTLAYRRLDPNVRALLELGV